MFKQPNTLKILVGTVLFGALSASLQADVKKELTYSANLAEGDTVVFTGDLSDVTVVKADSNEVRYDVELTYKSNNDSKAQKMFDKVEWTFDDKGPSIELKEKVKKARKLDIDVTIYLPDNHPLKINTCSGDIKVTNDFNTDVELDVVSGDATIQSIVGDLRLNTVSGDFTAKTITGNLNADSVSGDVKVQKVIGNTNVSSVSGDVTIHSASGSVRQNSVSGDFKISLTQESSGPIKGSAVSGDITISCNVDTDLKVRMNTVSGDLTCESSLQNIKASRDTLQGQVDEGKVTCTLDTVSGDITVENN